ncbi:hypothetical protein AT984_13785 [Paucibacter sp. KCTC 42545]|nr:hypothetical protein AT984_13785 [Paucibacter sp. KCTC 42545]
MKLILSFGLGLLMLAPVAQAGPVTLQASAPTTFAKEPIKATALTTDSYTFHLDAGAKVWGDLHTLAVKSGLPSINIVDAYLQSADGSQNFKFIETVAGDWDNGFNWQEQWRMGPTELGTGDWTLTVVQQGLGSKQYSFYQAKFGIEPNAANVPEPQMALLSLTALAAMGLVMRKRRSI